MGYHEAMDIRGIAWAGYFFDPGAEVPISVPVFIKPPEMEGEAVVTDLEVGVMKPSLGGEDTTIIPLPLKVEELDPGVDPEELKPKMKADDT
jgi:hypothetical protein